jgi:hypothetical protein
VAQAGVNCPLVLAGAFPVTFVGGRTPVITVKVRGVSLNMMVDSGAGISSITIPYGIENQTFRGIIDTGAYFTLVFQSALDRAGIQPSPPPANLTAWGFGVGGRKFSYRIEKFDNITVGAEQFSDAWLRVANVPVDEFADLSLGEDYLLTHQVFISNSTQSVPPGLTVAK